MTDSTKPRERINRRQLVAAVPGLSLAAIGIGSVQAAPEPINEPVTFRFPTAGTISGIETNPYEYAYTMHSSTGVIIRLHMVKLLGDNSIMWKVHEIAIQNADGTVRSHALSPTVLWKGWVASWDPTHMIAIPTKDDGIMIADVYVSGSTYVYQIDKDLRLTKTNNNAVSVDVNDHLIESPSYVWYGDERWRPERFSVNAIES